MSLRYKKTILFLGMFFGAVLIAAGQTTNGEVIITWRANNYFPADYVGKAAATPGTAISASAELITSGKLQNITGTNISWYLDGNLLNGGVGVKTVSFTAAGQNQGYQILSASINTKGGIIEGSTRIPVTQPEVVLNFPYPEKSVKAESQITVSAIPLFFNVFSFENLKFDWRINNEKTQADGNKITVNIGTPKSDFQNSIQIITTAQNTKNPLEFARGTLTLPIIQ